MLTTISIFFIRICLCCLFHLVTGHVFLPIFMLAICYCIADTVNKAGVKALDDATCGRQSLELIT